MQEIPPHSRISSWTGCLPDHTIQPHEVDREGQDVFTKTCSSRETLLPASSTPGPGIRRRPRGGDVDGARGKGRRRTALAASAVASTGCGSSSHTRVARPSRASTSDAALQHPQYTCTDTSRGGRPRPGARRSGPGSGSRCGTGRRRPALGGVPGSGGRVATVVSATAVRWLSRIQETWGPFHGGVTAVAAGPYRDDEHPGPGMSLALHPSSPNTAPTPEYLLVRLSKAPAA